jgi:hypothetical protein
LGSSRGALRAENGDVTPTKKCWWLCQFFVTKNGKEKMSWDKPGLVGGLK